ncbi:MAG: SRPBCC family protein [Comamonadaceae bacterium]|nr:SRPBCC family protein [Comamonadaceae bacterium]
MRALLAAAVLICASTLALAHGPTRQKVTETATIKAAPDAVWNKVKDFNGMAAWHPAVEGSTATDGSKEGSVRTLSLKGGGQMVETLEGYSDAERKFSYRAKDGGALPVTNYTSTLTVKAGDGGTTAGRVARRLLPRLPQQQPAPRPGRRCGREGHHRRLSVRPRQPEEDHGEMSGGVR